MVKTNKRSWPILYNLAKTGKIKVWKIETVSNMILITHGYEGHKLTKTEKLVHVGKNINKTNATTPEQQAQSEAQSKWQAQVDRKGYVDDKDKINKAVSYYPMLALKAYGPRSPEVLKGTKKITKLPSHVIIQSKLNGVRAIAVKLDNKVTLWSRRMNSYDVPSVLISELNKIMLNTEIWDGEIYVHGWGLERIISALKKRNDDTDHLEFHRYDCPSFNGSMDDRLKTMRYLLSTPIVKQVTSHYISSDWSLLENAHDLFIKQGYEGLIIRDPQANYLWGHRGKELYKYKEMLDEEFTIVGYKQGSGSSDGAICWRCRTPVSIKDRLYVGQRYEYFDVVPNGTIESRRDLFKNGWRYVGRLLTVRFQAYSVYGVPIFPKGIIIRDYE